MRVLLLCLNTEPKCALIKQNNMTARFIDKSYISCHYQDVGRKIVKRINWGGVNRSSLTSAGSGAEGSVCSSSSSLGECALWMSQRRVTSAQINFFTEKVYTWTNIASNALYLSHYLHRSVQIYLKYSDFTLRIWIWSLAAQLELYGKGRTSWHQSLVSHTPAPAVINRAESTPELPLLMLSCSAGNILCGWRKAS